MPDVVSGQLAADLTSDRTASACYQDCFSLHIAQDCIEIHPDGISWQQILNFYFLSDLFSSFIAPTLILLRFSPVFSYPVPADNLPVNTAFQVLNENLLSVFRRSEIPADYSAVGTESEY